MLRKLVGHESSNSSLVVGVGVLVQCRLGADGAHDLCGVHVVVVSMDGEEGRLACCVNRL